jgi:hypothetical protein
MVQARERQMRLGLDSRRRQYLVAGRPASVGGGAQQRGLPNAGITKQHDRSAAVGDLIDQAGQNPELGIPSDQSRRGHYIRARGRQQMLDEGRPARAAVTSAQPGRPAPTRQCGRRQPGPDPAL